MPSQQRVMKLLNPARAGCISAVAVFTAFQAQARIRKRLILLGLRLVFSLNADKRWKELATGGQGCVQLRGVCSRGVGTLHRVGLMLPKPRWQTNSQVQAP